MQHKEKLLLGVDPGTQIMGYALLSISAQNTLHMVHIDVIRLNKVKDIFERLGMIQTSMSQVIKKYKPDEMAIEAPFFGKNVQSMLKLGRAQGVAIAVAMEAGLPVTEYSPRKIKQAITGNGNAGKEQVLNILQAILQTELRTSTYDATDALAVAVCHHFQNGIIPRAKSATKTKAGKSKGWEDFLKQHPNRVRTR